MTDPYTPEKVAELAERLRSIAESQRMDFESPHVGMTLDESAAALTAVSAERDHLRRFDWLKQNNRVQADRDRLHKAITEALATAPKLGELRWRNVDRMIGILRAALDKEGNDES